MVQSPHFKCWRLAFFGLVAMGWATSASAGDLISELKIGILDHDVPDLWSGFRREENSADINLEALLS
ncbi:MAG: hypothetical protein WBP94_08985, partial [Rhodomicrobiaceae bacterium]